MTKRKDTGAKPAPSTRSAGPQKRQKSNKERKGWIVVTEEVRRGRRRTFAESPSAKELVPRGASLDDMEEVGPGVWWCSRRPYEWRSVVEDVEQDIDSTTVEGLRRIATERLISFYAENSAQRAVLRRAIETAIVNFSFASDQTS